MKKILKQKKGITLIALVITIIVLLILAGISISMLAGDNSILQKATDAKTQTGVGQEKEAITLAYNSALAKKVSNGNSNAVTDSELNDELDSSEATASGNPIIVTFRKSGNAYEIDNNGVIKESTPRNPNTTLKVADHKNEKFATNTELEDSFGNTIVVPAGFKITNDSPNSVTGGIIIEDVDAGTAETAGSQFVWIPVGTIYTNKNKTEFNTITLGRYEFDSNGNPFKYGAINVSLVRQFISVMPGQTETDQMLGSGAYSELSALVGKEDSEIQSWIDEDGTVKNNLEELYFVCTEEDVSREGSSSIGGANATAKNLTEFLSKANNGYYIGRYEARTTETRSSAHRGHVETVVTEKSADSIYNYINQVEASERSRNMYSSTFFESDLMNSYAWDTAIVFLQMFDDRNDKTTKYSLQSSLNDSFSQYGTTADVICNIYDMASNGCEFTTETYSLNDGAKYCTMRGGSIYNSNGEMVTGTGTGLRDWMNNSDRDPPFCFRPIIYLK